MELRITATDLARRAGEILGKIRFRRDSFLIERNGEVIARLSPVPSSGSTLAEGLLAWRESGPPDPGFADDLERAHRADRPPRNPWAS
ncbi:MAG: hypothetical protein WD646_08385 [Actinomycetota bacterium]